MHIAEASESFLISLSEVAPECFMVSALCQVDNFFGKQKGRKGSV